RVRTTSYQRDHGLFHTANRMKNVSERLGIVDVLLPRSVQHLFERGYICASAKVGTVTIDGDDANWSLTESEQRIGELLRSNSIERILLFRTRQCDSADCAIDGYSNVLHLATGSSSLFASVSGTSIVIRRSAVEYTLPWASVLSESVPP